METTKLTDREFFTDCVNRSEPDLASLADLAQRGEFAEAQRIFADTVRRTLSPELYLAGERERLSPEKERILAAAEKVMAHTLSSVGVEHTFPGEIDWTANPTYNAYKEWPWQLNRHPAWKTLAEAYILTGDRAYADEWAAQLIGWTKQAQVPRHVSGYDTVLWRTIEAGLRMSVWGTCIHAFLPVLSDEVITVFFKSVWEHGRRLREDCTARNWLIMEMHGLARIGLFYPFLAQSGEWLAYAHTRLEAELDIQVYPDGMQNELTIGYQHTVVENYEDTLEMYRRTGRTAPAYLEEGLGKLYDLYPKAARPDLYCPTMNDSGLHYAPKLLTPALSLYPHRQDYRWFASERRKGSPPPFTSVRLEYGGCVFMRSGWDADAYWAYMDASPLGTAHWHEDKLNIQLFALGHELLTEAGLFFYDTSEMRRYSISTRSHNTIRVDGCDQASAGMHPWKPEMIREKVELFWQTDESRDVAEASYTDGYGPDHIPVIHTRRLIFLKNETSLPPLFLVIDRLTARDDVPHSYEILWHLCDNPVSLHRLTAESAYPDGVGLTVSSSGGGMSVVRGQKTPLWQGWAPNLTPGDVEHFPIPTVVNTGVFRGSLRTVTVLCPYDGNAPRITAVRASDNITDTSVSLCTADGTWVTVHE